MTKIEMTIIFTSTEVPLQSQLLFNKIPFWGRKQFPFVWSSLKWFKYILQNSLVAPFHIFLVSGNLVYCWISDKTATIVVMVTLVTVALVFNITCLTKCFVAFRRLQQVCGTMAEQLHLNFQRFQFIFIECWVRYQRVMVLFFFLGL